MHHTYNEKVNHHCIRRSLQRAACQNRSGPHQPGLDSLARPHVVDTELDEAYKVMASDRQREAEAMEWSENLVADVADEAR